MQIICTTRISPLWVLNIFHPVSVDGNWGPWSEFNSCSVTCGEGTQSRSRSCDNPPPAYDGADCNGDGTETRSCNTIECPVDGNWGTWSEFSMCCSVTCGVIEQKRSRVCDNPPPGLGGADCPGDSEETRSCDSTDCLDTAPSPLCEDQSFDVMGLVDVSSLITDDEIAQERDLIQKLYTELRIDGNLRRFGFIAHGGFAPSDLNRLMLGVDDTTTQQSRIGGISKIPGPPRLNVAVDELVSNLRRFGRTGIRQIGIVIEAYESSTISQVASYANTATVEDIALYAIGIGTRVSEEFVQAIASNPSGAITMTSNQLEETATRLEQLICLCDK
ncbi:coadhesin isoform X2 [Patella vulgata]|uniref:coadhesin isoform X2 n=1 Tax=Patella vulgata TaxID=6465 RepID=UPI00217FE101|nr:coadhesin isoform X2 [Patella vulgata]